MAAIPQKIKSILRLIVAITLIISITGCSAFRPARQVITVKTSEPKAQIWINNNLEGETPVTKSVKRNKAVSILVTRKGFFPTTRTIDRHLSKTAILDIIGTGLFLFPGIGLLTPGAWDLDETEVFVHLLPKHQYSKTKKKSDRDEDDENDEDEEDDG